MCVKKCKLPGTCSCGPLGNSKVQWDKLLPMLWRTCCCIFR